MNLKIKKNIFYCLVLIVFSANSQVAQRLTNVFPEPSLSYLDNEGFSFSSDYVPSNSYWVTTFDERIVYKAFMKYESSDNEDQSYELRIGKGGQIYSFRTSAGESVPPQGDTAPWVDEVWQMVLVDSNPPAELNAGSNGVFSHISGRYFKPEFGMEEPFYCPQVAEYYDEEAKSYTTVNWAQPSHIVPEIDENYSSFLLCYSTFTSLGDGIIQVDYLVYNFSDHDINHINLPWGGVRNSVYGSQFISSSDNSFAFDNSNYSGRPNTTNGWVAYSSDDSGNAPSLGIMINNTTNTNIDGNFLLRSTLNGSEASIRDYRLYTGIINATSLGSGESMRVRNYFLVDDAVSSIQNTVAQLDLQSHTYLGYENLQKNNSDVSYFVFENDGEGYLNTVETSNEEALQLHLQPYNNSYPIFKIKGRDGENVITTNLYSLSRIPWDGKAEKIELLGYSDHRAEVQLKQVEICSGDNYTLDNGTTLQGVTEDTTITVELGLDSNGYMQYVQNHISVKSDLEILPITENLTTGQEINGKEIFVRSQDSFVLSPILNFSTEGASAIGNESDWSWSGPNGFSQSGRKLSLNHLNASQEGEYTVTYDRDCGASITLTYTIQVSCKRELNLFDYSITPSSIQAPYDSQTGGEFTEEYQLSNNPNIQNLSSSSISSRFDKTAGTYNYAQVRYDISNISIPTNTNSVTFSLRALLFPENISNIDNLSDDTRSIQLFLRDNIGGTNLNQIPGPTLYFEDINDWTDFETIIQSNNDISKYDQLIIMFMTGNRYPQDVSGTDLNETFSYYFDKLTLVDDSEWEIVPITNISNRNTSNESIFSVPSYSELTFSPELSASGISSTSSNEKWSWTGPNGFTYRGRVLSFSFIDKQNAGDYTVTYNGDCGVLTHTFQISVDCRNEFDLMNLTEYPLIHFLPSPPVGGRVFHRIDLGEEQGVTLPNNEAQNATKFTKKPGENLYSQVRYNIEEGIIPNGSTVTFKLNTIMLPAVTNNINNIGDQSRSIRFVLRDNDSETGAPQLASQYEYFDNINTWTEMSFSFTSDDFSNYDQLIIMFLSGKSYPQDINGNNLDEDFVFYYDQLTINKAIACQGPTCTSEYLLNDACECVASVESNLRCDIIEAEDYSDNSGIQTDDANTKVILVNNGDWVKYENVNFGSGVNSILASVSSANSGGTIQVRTGSVDGNILGSIAITPTGGWNTFETFTSNISAVSGVQDVYLVFTGSDTGFLLDIDWFQFTVSDTVVSDDFVPDPTKVYYIDSPFFNLRLAADGQSEDAYTTSTATTGADVEWQFVAKGNGTWHIQRAAGGDNSRLRTDNTEFADMQSSDWNGVYTYYDFSVGSIANSYYITLPDGPSEHQRLQVNPQGLVRFMPTSHAGTWESFRIIEVEPTVNFERIEAEDYDTMNGVDTQGTTDTGGGQNVGWIHNGDWLMFEDVNLTGAQSVDMRIACNFIGGTVEVRIGSSTGTLIGEIDVTNTGGNQSWVTLGTNITSVSGNQDVYLVFTGGNGFLYNINWLEFSSSSTSAKSIGAININDVTIFPNPVESTTTISGSADSVVKIFDVTGKVLFTKSIESDNEQLDLSSLPTGIYFAQIYGSQSISFNKILKK